MERLERLAELAKQAKNGHPELTEDLLRESAGIAHAVARARLGDTFAAEEAAADALARAARGLPGLADPQAYPHWLARIAARAAADAGRRRSGAVPPPGEVVDGRDGPAEVVRRAERAAAVRVAVRLLPASLRIPVLLHFTEAFSYREIATTLGTSVSTVARRMEKALRKLKKLMGEEP